MKKLLLALLLVTALFFVSEKEAEAHWTGVPHAHVGYTGNVVFGYGWWGWGYPAYGYSYYPYWGYQPYYATYAAIAVAKESERVGYSWGNATRRSAERAAVSQCADQDCRSVVWVQGGCASVSASEDNEKLGWGYHTTRQGAVRAAQRGCQNSGGENCRSLAWVCSY